jgi:cobyrinic acid a,c-diamide synthase
VPRIVIGAPASGSGKTTFTVGLIRALRRLGLTVAVFKCGPDYLDPTYHARACGRPSHNLDGWMMGREAVLRTFAEVSAGADIALIEGVMGLFDGVSPVADEGSTAEIAKWLAAPVLLVVDASGLARTLAAIVQGFVNFDPHLRLAGVLCNRVGSRAHLDLLRQATTEVPVIGGLPQDRAHSFPERHLGLLTADENSAPEPLLDAWSETVTDWCDLDRILAAARSAPALAIPSVEPDAGAAVRCRIGVAMDAAFHFYYADNLQQLRAAGAELDFFSPLSATRLPQVDGLYFGGGYPEVHARELAANGAMRGAVARFAADGGLIYAECGGLMYLADSIRTLDGQEFPMAGVIGSQAVMCERLQALGYVEVTTTVPSPLGAAGINLRGHQFRYSELRPTPANVSRIYRVRRRWGGSEFVEGYLTGNVLASYVHLHWASTPQVPYALAAACARRKADVQR